MECDLVFVGARVIDPDSGLDGVRAVGVRGGTVVSVSPAAPPARVVINSSGLVLAPGFIDLHSHAQDLAGARLQALDGVTTALELEAGALPVAERYRRAAEEGRPINFGYSAGWEVARMHLFDGVEPSGEALDVGNRHVQGPNWNKPAAARDVARLVDLLEQGVHEGALGFGILLGYAPETSRSEFVALATRAAALDVPCFVHVRTPGLEGVREVADVAEATGAHLHLCHLNSSGAADVVAACALIAEARGRGARLSTEGYPYGASSTNLGAPFLAPELLSGPTTAITYLLTGERIADVDRLRRLRREDPGGLVVVDYLDETDPADRALLMNTLLFDDTVVATDAMPIMEAGVRLAGSTWPVPDTARVHPRSASGYARVFGWMVRDLGVLTLSEAVRRCSLLPAQLLSGVAPAMRRKGRVAVGADADLVLFDPAVIADRATYTRVAPSAGIAHVLVGGQFVVRDGGLLLNARPGRAVRSGRYIL